jgi:hypothetical protein
MAAGRPAPRLDFGNYQSGSEPMTLKFLLPFAAVILAILVFELIVWADTQLLLMAGP